jgi:hypothetical protein
MTKLGIVAVMAVLQTTSHVFAVELLTQEPGKGKLKSGAVVYVDDGACGKGQVKRVVGGNSRKGEGRKTSCVKSPK